MTGAGDALGREVKRDFSLRRPTLSQERKGKKKSASSVRNDGQGGRAKADPSRRGGFGMTKHSQRVLLTVGSRGGA